MTDGRWFAMRCVHCGVCRAGTKSQFLRAKPVHRHMCNVDGVVFSRVLPGLLCRSTSRPVFWCRTQHPAAVVSDAATNPSDSADFRQNASSPAGKLGAHFMYKWERPGRHHRVEKGSAATANINIKICSWSSEVPHGCYFWQRPC